MSKSDELLDALKEIERLNRELSEKIYLVKLSSTALHQGASVLFDRGNMKMGRHLMSVFSECQEALNQ